MAEIVANLEERNHKDDNGGCCELKIRSFLLGEKDVLIKEHLLRAAKDGRVSCAGALAIARELAVPAHDVGRVADAINIRIAKCQLGCF